MHINVALRVDDLANPVPTGVRQPRRTWQVRLVEDSSVHTYVTAADAYRIHQAWLTLYEELALMERKAAARAADTLGADDTDPTPAAGTARPTEEVDV